MAVLLSVLQHPLLARAVTHLRTHKDNVFADRAASRDATKMANALRNGVQDLKDLVPSVIGMAIP